MKKSSGHQLGSGKPSKTKWVKFPALSCRIFIRSCRHDWFHIEATTRLIEGTACSMGLVVED
ncbi:hypothetical protein ACNKHO_25550 [Shigella flexneri]